MLYNKCEYPIGKKTWNDLGSKERQYEEESVFDSLHSHLCFAGSDSGRNVSLTKQNKNFNEKKLEKQTDKYLQKWFTTDHKGQVEQLESAIAVL